MKNTPEQSDKKYLIFEGQGQCSNKNSDLIPSECTNWFWSDRLFVIKNEIQFNPQFWSFAVFDFLMDELRPVHFRRSPNSFDSLSIHPLIDGFGLIVETSSNVFQNSLFHINLIKLNWDTNEFQLIEKFERECRGLKIFVDKAQPSKFVLELSQNLRTCTYQLCKLSKEEEIEFGKVYNISYFMYYSNDMLLKIYNWNAVTFDLNSNERETVELDKPFSANDISWHNDKYCEYFNGRLYKPVQVQKTQNYRILWTDLVGKRWRFLNFQTTFWIKSLEFFNENLMVYTKSPGYVPPVKKYLMPMKRPHYLRYLAWVDVVKFMKERNEKDPYKAAKEYLPLTSDLRAPWFKDEETVEQKLKALKVN